MVKSTQAKTKINQWFRNEFKEEKHELTAELCKSCDAALVRIIGNVAVLYKPAEKPADRKYEKELKKLDFKKN